MRRLIPGALLVVCVIMFTVSCETEGTVDPAFKSYFIKYYGGDGNQEAKDFVVNADGSIVIVGTWTETTGRRRIYIVKTDTEGNVVWDKRMGDGVHDELAADIALVTHGTDAGNLVILSNYRKNSIDSMAIRLTVVSQTGDSLKSTLLDFYGNQFARSVTPFEGGYYISAKTSDPANTGNPNDPTLDNVLYIKLQSDFSVYPDGYSQVSGYGIASAVRIHSLSPTQYFVAGYSDIDEGGTNPGRTSNLFFWSFTENGSGGTTATRVFSGSNDSDEIMADIARSPSGQFMAVGTIVSGTSRIMMASRVSGSFQTASQIQNILQNAEGVAVAPSGGSDFLILGNLLGAGGNRNIFVQKVDLAFGELMTLQFGSSNNDDTGSAIAELPNGDILILGTMELVNQKKMALIKVKPNGKF